MLLFDRILPIVLLVAAVGALFASVVVVRQQHVAVVERFGRFNRVLRPGLNLLVPVVETAHDVSLMSPAPTSGSPASTSRSTPSPTPWDR